ncbi:MAG: hypothetical protein QM536_01530 [Chitinophagaceae bacterium]|nr:hypothetical protein [Chitinophagaceae bacterium]
MLSLQKKIFLFIFLVFFLVKKTDAQCSMCRSNIETHITEHNTVEVGENLNAGILYLLSTPYILIGVVMYLWYKRARRASSQKQ